MVLVAVRWLNKQRILEESLPLFRKLSLDQMCHNEELLIVRALEMDEWHFFVRRKKFVVNSHDKGSPWLLLFLDEFKVLDIVNLDVFHFYFILRLKKVNSFLV